MEENRDKKHPNARGYLPASYASELPLEIQGAIPLLKGRHLVLSEMPEGV